MMNTNKTALNDEQLEAVCGAGKGILDYVGDGIGYLFDEITEKLDDVIGYPNDHSTGKQVMPGFNVY